MTRSHVRCQSVLLFALLTVVALFSPLASVAAATRLPDATRAVTAGPVLTGAACTSGNPGILMVTGEAFSPGGEVDVVLSGSESSDPAVIHSVRASQSMFGPNGSNDPAVGFQHGGFVGITLGHRCEGMATVRAYDRQMAAWSNQLPVELGCATIR